MAIGHGNGGGSEVRAGKTHREGSHVAVWFPPLALMDEHPTAGHSPVKTIGVAANAAEKLGKDLAAELIWGLPLVVKAMTTKKVVDWCDWDIRCG
jgi:hypothetical protein